MEYITPKQFLEQPKEVQQTFLEWWKPTFGDLLINKYDYNCNIQCVTRFIGKDILTTGRIKVEDCIPLLTEGQLRKFIEDKTNCYLDMEHAEYNINSEGYYIFLFDKDTHSLEYDFTDWDLGNNLLQAYWQVACKFAKEE